MKREITKLEQKLIDNGYKLEFKSYVGKHSQKVEYYCYKGHLENYEVLIYLDSKRSRVDHYCFENKTPRFIGLENIETLERVYRELTNFIYSLSVDYTLTENVDVDETIAILESENE